jgi:hypothetical protein
MPKYHKIVNPELGNDVSFYGNLGAVANFEDFTGVPITEIFKEGKVKFSEIVRFMYECYKISHMRQKISYVDFETFKLYTDNSILKVFPLVLADIMEEMGMNEDSQKKAK